MRYLLRGLLRSGRQPPAVRKRKEKKQVMEVEKLKVKLKDVRPYPSRPLLVQPLQERR